MKKSAENTILIGNDVLFSHIEELIFAGERVELRIKGRSMQPTLQDGKDRVVLSPLSAHDLYIGAIVLFRHKNQYFLHRLISVTNDTLIFQGDNLRFIYEKTEGENIVAIVEYIIKNEGKTIDCFHSNYIRKAKYKVYWLKMRNKFRVLLTKIFSFRFLSKV